MKTILCTLLSFALVALLLPGCAPPDNRAADEAAIRAADLAWSGMAESGNLEGYLAVLLDDAIMLGPNQAMITDRDLIRKTTAEMFGMPGFSLKWQPTRVEAARSGDLGYSLGTYEFSGGLPDGTPITDRGKYATVWKKQADGSWKVALDSYSSDLPFMQPPAE
jgi:ketosteroid isomerase-like protein